MSLAERRDFNIHTPPDFDMDSRFSAISGQGSSIGVQGEDDAIRDTDGDAAVSRL